VAAQGPIGPSLTMIIWMELDGSMQVAHTLNYYTLLLLPHVGVGWVDTCIVHLDLNLTRLWDWDGLFSNFEDLTVVVVV